MIKTRLASDRTCTALAICAILAVFTACHGHEDDGHDHMDAAPVDCSTETRADTYVAGLQKDGANGYSMLLVESQPAPPAKGDNTWTVQLLGDAGAPVDGATLLVTPFMPDHGHGTPITAEITPEGADGRYTITTVNLWMPGLWEVTVEIDDQGVGDSVMYAFCIDG